MDTVAVSRRERAAPRAAEASPLLRRGPLPLAVVGLLVVPLQMTLIPILRIFTGLGLTGSFLAIWLAHTGYGLPFAIYLLRNFFGGLPREMFESAYLDGAGPWTTFFRLVLPL